MPWYEVAALLAAGMAAGTINTIVGSGTLITFPMLLFFGYPPVVANVSNTVGLVAGGITGIHGYRRELVGQGSTLRRFLPASFCGAVTGAILLLWLPESAFDAIVPVLIAAALLLVLLGRRIQAWAASRHPDHDSRGRRLLLTVGIFGAGVYGGYFGASAGHPAGWHHERPDDDWSPTHQWAQERIGHGGQCRCSRYLYPGRPGSDRLVCCRPDRGGCTCRGVRRITCWAATVTGDASCADRRYRGRGHWEDNGLRHRSS